MSRGRDKRLNGGAIIPIPEREEGGRGGRASSALLWGEIVNEPRPFLENTRKRGQLLKIILLLRLGKKQFQRLHIPSDSPFYLTARALEKGDRIIVTGTYTEHDGVRKKDQVQIVVRDFYPGFLVPMLAVTDPDGWRARLCNTPDPLYEKDQILTEKEAEELTRGDYYIPDYADEIYNTEAHPMFESGR